MTDTKRGERKKNVFLEIKSLHLICDVFSLMIIHSLQIWSSWSRETVTNSVLSENKELGNNIFIYLFIKLL